jgi:hypothetical protein
MGGQQRRRGARRVIQAAVSRLTARSRAAAASASLSL